MSPEVKTAVLLYILRAYPVKLPNKEIYFQRTVFLLQTLANIPLGYEYNLSFPFGPYCLDLSLDLSRLRSNPRLVEGKREDDSWGFRLVLTQEGETVLAGMASSIKEYTGIIDKKFAEWGELGENELRQLVVEAVKKTAPAAPIPKVKPDLEINYRSWPQSDCCGG